MTSIQFKIANYLPKSFIIIEGKKESHNFYIIRSGNVRLMKENPVVSEDLNPVLGPGDFFGVISCMSINSRIETAVSLSNTSLISVERDQFGTLIQRNPAVALKIIRFFSKKLRIFNDAITRLTLMTSAGENPEHLYNIGEYYLNKKVRNHSVYAYQRYLQYCPKGGQRDKAISRLKALKAPLATNAQPSKELTRTYQDNVMIFCEHEPGNELYIIQSGKVKITKIVDEEVLLAVLNPGDIFGEMALLDNKPRSASAITFGDAILLVINKENFEGMVHAKPQMATKLIQLLSERIWTAYRQLENLMIKDPIGRIYDTLLLQLEKQKIKIEPKKNHTFDFGTNELLKMVGIPGSKGKEIIINLLKDKYFSLENGKILCLDTEELEKTVHFFKKKAILERKREASKTI